MIRHTFVIALSLLMIGVRAVRPQSAQATLVEVHGHKLNVEVGGTTKAGVPTVVFSNGLAAPISLWNDVRADLENVTRTIAYDRAGTFGSGPMTETPTLKQIVSDLHELLQKVDARPPYVLVGHSYGGVIIHSFAALYRSEVVGLVYVDPTDFTQTVEDERALLAKAGVKGGRDAIAKINEQSVSAAPSGIIAENREIDRVEAGGFAEYRADGEPPDVPTVVLLAGQTPFQRASLTFSGDLGSYLDALRDQRVAHFSQWVERLTNGTLVLTTSSNHIMQSSEPDLIAWSIRRVLRAAGPRRPDLDRLTGKYTRAPGFAMTISRLGDKLLFQATNQPVLVMAQESPAVFTIESIGARIEFEFDDAGAVTALSLAQNGTRQRLRRAK